MPPERSLSVKENTSQEKKTARRGRIAGQNMKKDSSTTLLFKTSNENFAELFNRTMSDFDQLRPEDLSEEDIKEAAYLRITKADGGTALVQYRDVVKSARNGRIFAILGIEQQSEVDYAMPFRVLELDFVNYARQVQIIRERHLDAMALRCWEEMQTVLGVAPCVLLSELNDRGVVASCEIDLCSAINMYSLMLASEQPAACVDWNNNYGDDPDKVILFHCGPIAQSLMEKKGIFAAMWNSYTRAADWKIAKSS